MNNRFTINLALSDNYAIIGQKCTYGTLKELGFYDAINKLGKLENIEEEIGIDLVTLFTTKEVYTKVNVMKPMKDKQGLSREQYIVCLNLYGIDIESKEIILGSKYKTFSRKIEDYGKTWALTEDELQ